MWHKISQCLWDAGSGEPDLQEGKISEKIVHRVVELMVSTHKHSDTEIAHDSGHTQRGRRQTGILAVVEN